MKSKNSTTRWSTLTATLTIGWLILTGLAGAQPPAAFDPSIHCADPPVDVIIDFSQALQLPPDGILCFRNLTVTAGAALRFVPNGLNTPAYVLATEDIEIAGVVDLDGKGPNGGTGGFGGPGGFQGGSPGVNGVSEPGAGHGPGAGLGGDDEFPGGGRASYGNRPAPPRSGDGVIYGNALLIPLVGGSGGGGGRGNPGGGGGGGGGAVLLAANGTLRVTGAIQAEGAYPAGNTGFGSGGAIRLVAPKVEGTGQLLVRSGNGAGGTGGLGRIRIDTFDTSDLALISVGMASSGSFVVAFPDPLPRLDILHVAGQDIPEGTTDGVVVQLPPGSDPMQLVRVQATDFPEAVTVDVVASPESGPPSVAQAIAAAGSGIVEVLVEIPENSVTHVFAWVR